MLVDGVPAAVRGDEVVNRGGRAGRVSRRLEPECAGVAHAGFVDPGAAAVALRAARRHARARLCREVGCGKVLPPGTQRLRNAVETLAGEPAAAAAYGGNVEGWLQLGRLSGMARRTRRADPAPPCRPGQAADGRRASTTNTTFRDRLGNRVATATRRRLHRGPRQRRRRTPQERGTGSHRGRTEDA